MNTNKPAFARPTRYIRTAALSVSQQESNRQLHVLARDLRVIRRLEEEGRRHEAARATSHLRAKAAMHGLTDEIERLLPGVEGPRLHSASNSLRRWW